MAVWPFQGAGGGEAEAAAALPERRAPAVPPSGAEGVSEAGGGAQEAERYWARWPEALPVLGLLRLGRELTSTLFPEMLLSQPSLPCRSEEAHFAASPLARSSSEAARTTERLGLGSWASRGLDSHALPPGCATFSRSPHPSGPGSSSIRRVS